ncbi:hypothetical protein F4679DRAFT_555573 [Xylaria curta]|nr:hypothetical protein F4679DRAFT_555573 [Xylaria curta]
MTRQYRDSRYPGPGNSNTTAPVPDFPDHSIPYVQNEPQIPEHKRQKVPNTSAADSKGTSTEVPDDDESEQKAKPVRRTCSIRFAEDVEQDRGGRANGNVPGRRRRSPYPLSTQECKTSQKAVPIPIPIPASNNKNIQRDAPPLEDDVISLADNADDNQSDNNAGGGNDDDSDQDVTIETNPLADYPRIGNSLSRPKRRPKARGAAQPSLFPDGIRRYDRICEDTAFAERVQRALDCQGKLSRRQEKKLQQLREEGEKTRIPAFTKPDGQDWGFEMTEPGCDGTTVFGEAVVPVYYPRKEDDDSKTT